MYRSHVSLYTQGQGSMEGRLHHVVLHGVCITLAMVSQVFSETFHVLASGTNSGGLFRTTMDNVSESFPLEVTMDCWADNTWIMLRIWSSAWLIHSLFTVFQSDLLPSLFFKWVMPVHSFQMLYVSYRNLHNHRAWLAINNPKEPWWTRYLTQNGLAVFGWWTLLEALVSLGVVLRYQAGLPDPLVSSMVLTLLLLGMLIWFVFESFIFSKYIRYTFTVYPVLIVGLGAMVPNAGSNDDTSKYLTKEPNHKPDFCKTVCQPMGKDSTMASQTGF
ncbi:unnamed protein product, partial [Coregonus sp. 'balchen']